MSLADEHTIRNGSHRPAALPVGAKPATPLCTKIAMVMLWLAVLDRDDAAITRALALLPDGPEERGIALGMARIGLSIEPRLRCDAARENLLDLLGVYALSRRSLTEGL
ncbi:hypothetical protein [Mycolicibacterium fortuitum]|uniref:hypothetical protein n=1 Tax=Mycolicibacterium fortuitum TaxID=1766 RepID=UPI00149083DE|nr:hypothetical protein [Mycolicibacterium fortuitum]NOR01362.1 hypothetical protein [Mycolicibacterium fortuitum]